MQWQAGGAKAEPTDRLDPSELPRGADDCLSGETFVLTGVLPHLSRRVPLSRARARFPPRSHAPRSSREEADALIKRHGGRVTGNVTGKTTFLLVCSRSCRLCEAAVLTHASYGARPATLNAPQVGAESGPSKVSKAKELKTQLIDEQGLFALIAASAPAGGAPAAAARPAAPAVARPPAPPPVPRSEAGPSSVGPSGAGACGAASREHFTQRRRAEPTVLW